MLLFLLFALAAAVLCHALPFLPTKIPASARFEMQLTLAIQTLITIRFG
jgi:hypothetical protein